MSLYITNLIEQKVLMFKKIDVASTTGLPVTFKFPVQQLGALVIVWTFIGEAVKRECIHGAS